MLCYALPNCSAVRAHGGQAGVPCRPYYTSKVLQACEPSKTGLTGALGFLEALEASWKWSNGEGARRDLHGR